ncbi:MAG: NhaC family sodium:proton (Na+:H+) antiporter [candidate division TM6 bacterium GW2011_GWA2_36_9]|nr:MAG: NhaC family sodium:proton (Na+:H+) antiporter [candidate division TM6 bacterium GW2011_GWA2_36_9]
MCKLLKNVNRKNIGSFMLNWLVILPPLLLLITAFLSRNIILSVLIGIASAAIIGAQFSITGTIDLLYIYLKKQFIDPDFFYIYGFLFILGSLIALINYTGGSCAFGNIITKKLKNARKTESTSLLLSLLLCFDDYLSTLTMGCLMQPLTDKFKIPRAKLEFRASPSAFQNLFTIK